MPAVELHPEHRARERLGDLTLHLDFLFLVGHSPFLRTHEKTAEQTPPRADHGSKPAFSLDFAVVNTLGGPSSSTTTVCSKWAAREPSLVEIDHSSPWRYTSGPPAVIIGSI